MTNDQQPQNTHDPAANSEQMSDDEAQRIAREQTSSASEHADDAGKSDDGRDVPPPAPEK